MNNKQQQGFILLFAIVTMGILLTMTTAFWGYTSVEIKSSRESINQAKLVQIAEAGIDNALHKLNTDFFFSGETNVTVGEGTYSTVLSSIGTNYKSITATAYIPNATNPIDQVTIKVNAGINLNVISFNFALQVGEGGVVMGSGSQISGNVFSNGDISGAGTITGDATVATGASPPLDQSCTTTNGNFDFNTTARRDVGQQFIPAITGPLTRVSVYIKKTGTPANASVRIFTDNGSNTPTKTQLGTTATINSSNVTGSYGWVNLAFTTSPTVTSGTKYWLVIDSSSSAASYYSWAHQTSNSCTGLGKSVSDWNAGSPSWAVTNSDMNYRTYVGGTTTSLSGITVNGKVRANTLNNCTIGDDAYYVFRTSCSVGGIAYPDSEDTQPATFPIAEAQFTEWKEVAVAAGTHSGNKTVSGTEVLGPLVIDGDLTVNGTLRITGPIWVQGDITVNNGATMTVDNSMGYAGTMIIAQDPDNPTTKGKVIIYNNANVGGNNYLGSYLLVAGRSTSGTAIRLQNNITGTSIYYADFANVTLSNNSTANQVTAYGLVLSNNVIVTYITGFQSSSFSTGPGGIWVADRGTYVITYD